MNNSNLFSGDLSEMKILNLESNYISYMNNDLLVNLKTLANLSLANNQLTLVTKEIFFYLLNLKYLNLSRNRIESIEINSFINLNRLLILDLSFNRLFLIQNDLFKGLIDLNELHLNNNSQYLTFENQSLSSILNIGNIYLNIDVIERYKCFFMHSIERVIRRNVASRYIFYKSINLLTTLDDENYLNCDLTLEFLQFNVHLNLKTDDANEDYYEKCKSNLIKPANEFLSSLKSCWSHVVIREKEILNLSLVSNFVLIISDYVFLLSFLVLMSLCMPVSFLICVHFYTALRVPRRLNFKVGLSLDKYKMGQEYKIGLDEFSFG